MNHSPTICGYRIRPRAARRVGDLHPFQQEVKQSLDDPAVRILKVSAPVATGKSKIIRDLVDQPRRRNQMLVLTYPTKILMDAQLGSLVQELTDSGRDVCVWPDLTTRFREGAVNLVNYSTDSLLRLLQAYGPNALREKRGDLLHRLFDEQDWFGREKALITTPDVLHLIVKRRYGRAGRLAQYLNAGATFVFDEFHLYHNLANFAPLLEEILADWNGRVVLLSATPILNADVAELCTRYSTREVSFVPGSVGDPANAADRCFNPSLHLTVDSFRTSDLGEWLERLWHLLPALARPLAVIVDSVHRLQWLKRGLRERLAGGDFELLEWSGLHKDRVALSERSIVLGTSAIEVGVNMDFRSLVMEATYWPSAIQRLGRVGRFRPGSAVIWSRRAFEPYLKDCVDWDRTEFEETVLQKALLAPSDFLIGGEMFRGDSAAFALIDRDTKVPYYYDQSVFAMFEIHDAIDQWRCLSQREKIQELRDWRVPERVSEQILLRDQVFPFWGLLLGSLRMKYQRVESCRETPDGLHVMADQRYFFEKG